MEQEFNSNNLKNNIEIKNKLFSKKVLITLSPLLIIFILFFTYFLMSPKILLKGDDIIKLSYLDTYKEEGATARFLWKDITPLIKTTGKVENKKVGEYKIEYKVDYLIYHKKLTRTVRIIDDKKPSITLNGNINQIVCPKHQYKEEGYKAFDEYDGDITDKVILKKEDNKIIYQVEDSSKNKDEKIREIIYQDNEKPKITLKGSSKQNIYLNNPYKEYGFTANDNCDGDITNKVTMSGKVDVNRIGTYTITYNVKDEFGNETSIERKVNVIKRSITNNNTIGKKGVIYLTFDDGPSNVTSGILDILKEEGVKATFFVTNNGDDYLIKRENDEGHTVALHTATHNYSKVYSSVDAYFNDLKIVHDRVQRITGKDSRIIRFPGGSSNTVSRRYTTGIMTTLTSEVLRQGYHYFDWNISSGDAGGAYNANQVYQSVINNLSKNRANMILMHDTKIYTRDALRNIIRYGKENGYSFEAITMNTPMITHQVNN